MKRIVIFFYIDALNFSFISPSTMPFLSKLRSDRCYRQLENVFGYSFAIQSCMLSGKTPEETEHWMPYFYSPEKSSILFKTFNKIGPKLALDRLPSIRHLMVGQSRRFLSRKGVHANNIPLKIIDKIALYPYYYMCELPFFQNFKDTLLKNYQATLRYIGPPMKKRNMYSSFLKHIKTTHLERELIIVYDDALDGLGHRLGPYSPECLHYAESLDHVLSAIFKKLINLFRKDFIFIVFSDHGQCNQSYSIDLLSRLSKNKLQLGKDYLCFIDATLVLFWSRNKSIKEKILEVLNAIQVGKVIDNNLQEKYHIQFNDERYGEIIFALEPGGTFDPNFFSPFGSMKGLHGYLPHEEVQRGFMISNEKFKKPLNHVKDVKDSLLEFYRS